MAGGILLFLITQLFVLGWAMFVAGRKGVLYKIQVAAIIILSFACFAIIAMGINGAIWFSLIQATVFLITTYVFYKYHPTRCCCMFRPHKTENQEDHPIE